MKNSAIQWTDHTFNPWEGCTKVAPECKNCYAETLVDHRFGRAKWGKGQPRRRTSKQLWKQPLRWNMEAAIPGAVNWNHIDDVGEPAKAFYRPRVFCLSLGDWLDEEVPIEWFVNLLEVIHATQNLDWQLLTKRPQNWQQRASNAFQFAMVNGADHGRQMDFTDWLGAWAHAHIAPNNIWIGVSAGADQKAALEIPAKIHFLSCEPMLHALYTTHATGFDWIIFGGESGKNARPLHVDWIRSGLAFCQANGIAAFIKQMGRNVVDRNDAGFEGDAGEWPMDTHTRNLDSGYQGAPVRVLLHDSHGSDMSEWPEDLRVREFPVVGSFENGLENK